MKILIKGLISLRRAISSTGDENNIYFIKHVSANINGEVLYDISLSDTIRQENFLLLKFNFLFKNRGNTINIAITDSKNIQTLHSVKIKSSLAKNSSLNSKEEGELKAINYWVEKPTLWHLTDTQEAIKELYGVTEGVPGIINVSEFGLSEYSGYPIINITSKLHMKSIAIFSEDLYESFRGKVPSIRAIISLPEGTAIDYSGL